MEFNAENVSITIPFMLPIRQETIYAKIDQSNIAECQSFQRTSSWVGEFEERKFKWIVKTNLTPGLFLSHQYIK